MSKSSQEVQCTFVADAVRLRPVLPSHDPRYTMIVDRDPSLACNTKIQKCMSIESLSAGALPDGWTEHISPEGQAYYYHTEWKIVTAADIRMADVASRLARGLGQLVAALGDRGALPHVEVYFNLGQGSTLDYYLVDHVNRQPFWVQDVGTDDIGLAPYESAGFLKSALQPEYWTHVDYYPCHQHLDEEAEMELIDTLRFYVVDDMTSPGSTSPYGAKECRQYIKLLEGFRASGSTSSSRIATIARLWASIARVRHINAYGLKQPRLDRLQGLYQYSSSQSQRSFKLSLAEALSFHRSRRTFQQLTALWNGRVVYQRHWQTFFEAMGREWLTMGTLSVAIFIADAVAIASGKPSTAYMASAALAGSAVFSSVFLHQRHTSGRLSTAPDISAYIVKVEDVTHGLRPLALTYTIPHALTMYAAVFLAMGLLILSMESAVTSAGLFLAMGAWCIPFCIAFFLASIF